MVLSRISGNYHSNVSSNIAKHGKFSHWKRKTYMSAVPKEISRLEHIPTFNTTHSILLCATACSQRI